MFSFVKCVAIMSALGKLGDIVKKSLAPGSLVFDWGCGCGHKAAYWKQYFDADTLGIDAVQANIEWARQRIPGAKFCQADGAHIEFLPSKLFDLAFSMAGVYHLEHAAQCEVLHEMCRSVRPGGLVVIVWHGRFKYQDPGRGSWKPCMDKYTARKTKLQVMDDVQVFGRHYMMQRVQADIDSGKADRGDELFTTYSIVVQMLD